MNIVKRCKHGMMSFNYKDIWTGKSLMNYGEVNDEEIEIISLSVKPGDAILDIGAGIGCLSVPISRKISPNGMVLSFEPEKNSFYNLCANVAINNRNNIFAFQQALCESLDVSIYMPDLDPSKCINYGGINPRNDYGNCVKYPVSVNTIDNLKLEKIDLIKIDVNGSEDKIIEGGLKTISKYLPILHIASLQSENTVKILQNLGYVIFYHQFNLFNPNNFFEEKENLFGLIKKSIFLCIQKGKSVNFDPIALGMKEVLLESDQKENSNLHEPFAERFASSDTNK